MLKTFKYKAKTEFSRGSLSVTGKIAANNAVHAMQRLYVQYGYEPQEVLSLTEEPKQYEEHR